MAKKKVTPRPANTVVLAADPNEIVHVHVKPGEIVEYEGKVYGDRATLQVPRRDLDRVKGPYVKVHPAKVPDVGER